MSSCVDLHIHTSASDGTDTPEAVLEKARRKGIRVFAVTDHDNVSGSLALDGKVPDGLRMIRGIEFSCRADLWKCHILGYGFDAADEVFQEVLEMGRRFRLEKLEKRLIFLKERYRIELTKQEMDWLMVQPSPGKPHLGQILVDRGLAASVSEAIEKYIKGTKGLDARTSAELAVKAILHAGGIPVWAHPLGGEGERRISREEFRSRLAELLDYGIRGLECCYSRYDEADIAFLTEQARLHGLLVSGGSDYHGSNKADLALGMLNAADSPVEPERLTVLDALGIW